MYQEKQFLISVLLRRKPCFIISKLCDLSHVVLCTKNIIIHVNIFSHFFLFHSYYFNDVIVKINLIYLIVFYNVYTVP